MLLCSSPMTRRSVLLQRLRVFPWPLLVIFAVQLAFWLAQPTQLGTTDIAAYAHKAFTMTDGTFFDAPANSIFSHRIGLLLPTAFLYWLAGVYDATTFLLPLLAALVLTSSVWFALRKSPHRAALGASVAAFTPICVEMMGTLFPDLVVTALSAAAIALTGERQRTNRPHMLAACTALLVLWAFSVKLTASYIFLPALALALVLDVRRGGLKALRFFHLPLVGYGLLGTVAILGFTWWLWGSPLARIDAVNSTEHLWNIAEADSDALFTRLFVDPWPILLRTFGFPLVLAVCALPLSARRYHLWATSLVMASLSVVFGSAATDHYQPLPLWPRMLLPMLPGIAVFTGVCCHR